MGSHFRCNCPVLKIRPEMSIYSISIHSAAGEEEGFNVPIQMLPQLELSSKYICSRHVFAKGPDCPILAC